MLNEQDDERDADCHQHAVLDRPEEAAEEGRGQGQQVGLAGLPHVRHNLPLEHGDDGGHNDGGQGGVGDPVEQACRNSGETRMSSGKRWPVGKQMLQDPHGRGEGREREKEGEGQVREEEGQLTSQKL